MSLDSRIQKIKKLESERKSRVICYINSDRPSNCPIAGMTMQISPDVQLHFYEHLKKIGKTKNIDLVLYTRGGNIETVWPLVSLIREFCDSFSVLVPFRAHSAGTMICLGANEIRMAKLAELSPIDPTTGNQFNPIDETNPRSRKGISVEDVTSYLDLAKEDFGIKKEENIVNIFKHLTDKIEPLALGNVKRVHKLIRRLADELLHLHFDEAKYSKKIEAIKKTLTSELYSHVHYINRQEAMKILGEEIVKFCSENEEAALWDVFVDYADTLKLKETFNIKEYMGTDVSKELEVVGAFIESADLSHTFNAKSKLTQRSKLPPNLQVQVQPGQAFPLIPGFPIEIEVDLISVGWKVNDGKI
ncbi:MAG TPA: hypothetical protein VI749_08955 [Candidatus Omnitrophota bacterium]|nr:hypothetical protein [Candidatus Omnitrophota bacterium]